MRRRFHLQLSDVPLTIFDTKGIPSTRRERIEAAIESGGKHVAAPFEAWIAADTFRGGVKVLITDPHGFECTVTFAERVRETLED